MDIQTIAVGGGVVASLVVLASRVSEGKTPIQLPIRIGTIEATAISMGVEEGLTERPMTHDLIKQIIEATGATLTGVAIVDVRGTTFFAELMMLTESERYVSVDCRPSDALALAVRMGVPIFAEEHVLEAATLPDFKGVERAEKEQEMERFHDFVESLSPTDFADGE